MVALRRSEGAKRSCRVYAQIWNQTCACDLLQSSFLLTSFPGSDRTRCCLTRALAFSRVLLMFVLSSVTKTNLVVLFFCEYSVLFFILPGMKRSWDRTEIVRCQCNELSYLHVHCPCSFCKGKPVSSSVEYRHWQQQEAVDTELDVSTSSLNQ